MAEDPGEHLPVKPQQLIGGINGMILQLHKMNSELEESKHKQQKDTETIKHLKTTNGNMEKEIDDLKKVKERLSEQSLFLEKSLKQKKTENNELLEQLKRAEIQLGESGSVLDTVRNLESKNEIMSVKMSSVVLNSEEEIAKVKTEQDHYIKFFEVTNSLNKQNMEIQMSLNEAEDVSKQNFEKAKVLLEKSEKTYYKMAKSLDELLLAKEKYIRFDEVREDLETKAQQSLEANGVLQRENNVLQKQMKELESRSGNLERSLKEQRKVCHFLNQQLTNMKKEKDKLYKEVHFLRKEMDKIERSATESAGPCSQDVERTKQYEALEKQMKLLAKSYGETTRQLGVLKESVDESKDLLKANIESPAVKDAEESLEENKDDSDDSGAGSLVSQEYVAVVLEMQGVFNHSDVRDEELACLEKMAGIPEQNVNMRESPSVGKGDCSVITSCVRGLVAMKDTQIEALTKERDVLGKEVVEKQQMEYRQQFLLNELMKEKEELLKKLAACQEKYSKAKDEKENARRELLVRNTTEKMTFNHMNNLKQENEEYKNALEKQKGITKQNYMTMKSDLDKKLETRNTLIQALRDKLVVFQKEKDTMISELNSRHIKDSAIKKQIMSMFEDKS